MGDSLMFGMRLKSLRRRTVVFVVSASTTVMVLSLVVLYLLVPGSWQWNHAAARVNTIRSNVVEQVVAVTPATSSQALVDRLKTASTSSQSAPIILTYHDVGYRQNDYTVTPEVFAAQMKLLADGGWSTLTADQLSAWLKGTPLPPHSVMITFDDGVRGVWKYADNILAANHQHAIAYIITGFVGTNVPYYMTWEEIQALQKSGRWDIEAHTHLGHVNIKTDENGTPGPFLTSLQWLPDQHRMETADEYHVRILGDLVECKRQLVDHGIPSPNFFAYPYSAHTDAPSGTNLLRDTVGSLFQAAMLDQAGSVSTTTTTNLSDFNIGRMDITSKVSLETWVNYLRDASPLNPVGLRPFAMAGDWITDDDRFKAQLPIENPDQVLRLDPGPHAYTGRIFARFRSSMWNTYTVSVRVGGFVAPADGMTVGLIALSGNWDNQVDVTISDGYFQVRRGMDKNNIVTTGNLAPDSAYTVVIAVHPEGVTVAVGGRQVYAFVIPPVSLDVSVAAPNSPRAVAGGIELSANREFETSPVPQFSDLKVDK